MRDLKTLFEQVKYVLTEHSNTRDKDEGLYGAIASYRGVDLESTTALALLVIRSQPGAVKRRRYSP